MNHGIDVIASHHSVERLRITEVGDDEMASARDRGAFPTLQVIDHGHAVTGCQRKLRHDAADVPGSPGYEQMHASPLKTRPRRAPRPATCESESRDRTADCSVRYRTCPARFASRTTRFDARRPATVRSIPAGRNTVLFAA